MNWSDRRKTGIRNLFYYMMGFMFLASCSENESGASLEGVDSGQAIAKFKAYFYKGGSVYANQLSAFAPAEWAVASKDAETPLNVFSDITGMQAPLKKQYTYNYAPSDGKCSIRIVGQSEPGGDAVFATMYVNMPGCEDIEVIHITTEEYFEGTNETQSGVPVIFIQDHRER